MTAALRAWVEPRVAGRVWWYRAPLLLIFAWIFKGYLDDPTAASIFSGINLALHEAGHAAFSWIGQRMLTTAGGTIFELGLPVAAGVYLARKQHDPFGATVSLFWLGTALVGVGVYAADARAGALPLVSPFGPVDPLSHDWGVMLQKVGMLSRDQQIGGAFRTAGFAAMLGSLVSGAWVLRMMARAGRPGSAGARGASPAPGAGPAEVEAGYDAGAGPDEANETPLSDELAAEQARLEAFMAGRPVERPQPKRRFKRSKGRRGSGPSPSGPRPHAPRDAGAAPPDTGGDGPGFAGLGRRGRLDSEEERFRKFLERDEE